MSLTPSLQFHRISQFIFKEQLSEVMSKKLVIFRLAKFSSIYNISCRRTIYLVINLNIYLYCNFQCVALSRDVYIFIKIRQYRPDPLFA